MSRLHKKISEKKPSIGLWITIPHPEIIEILSNLEFDWFVFDLEHAPLTIKDLEIMLMAMRGSDITPLARVPWNDPVYIKYVLDLGVEGVIVPLIRDAEDVKKALSYVKYPPEGIRGVGPRRCVRYGFDDIVRYYREWNTKAILITQIETREALDNLDSILDVDGLTGVFIGPNDLSATLGVFREFNNPIYINAIKKILETAKRREKLVGIMAQSIDDAKEKLAMGFNFVSLTSDYRILIHGAKLFIEALREYI